jgi:hypothetical protein
MAGGKRSPKGSVKRSAKPTGFLTVPRLSVPWVGDTPEDRAFGRSYLFERFQRGLELDTAVKEILRDRHVALMYPLARETVGLGFRGEWQSYAGSFEGDGMPAPDWQIRAVVNTYREYEDLVRTEFFKLHSTIRDEFISEALGSKDKPLSSRLAKVSQLASLKYVARAGRQKPSAHRERVGLLYYQWMRPFYYNAGLDEPYKALNEMNKTPVTFLGRQRGLAHKAIADVLGKAEEVLQRMGQLQVVTNSVKRAFAFVPRPQNEFHRLSNHALGRAIDIDARTNPHIQGTDAKKIDEVLTHLNVEAGFSKAFLSDDLSGMPHAEALVLYLKMTAISNAIQAFLKKHLTTWEKLTRQKKNDAIDMLLESEPYVHVGKLVDGLGGLAKAKIARDEGIFTMSALIFYAFKEAGAELNRHGHRGTDLSPHSGTEWKTEKDPMHWEVKSSTRLAPDQKGRKLERDRLSFAAWYARNV